VQLPEANSHALGDALAELPEHELAFWQRGTRWSKLFTQSRRLKRDTVSRPTCRDSIQMIGPFTDRCRSRSLVLNALLTISNEPPTSLDTAVSIYA
jgi:hypothetical protein